MDLYTLLLLAPPILLALVMHEYSHAWAANKFGDDTARQMGRLTLNPLAHLDLLGTVMIFLVHFGWAKPVPVNPWKLKNPKRDMLWISAAGPLMNMLLALVSGILISLLSPLAGQSRVTVAGLGLVMLVYSLQINLALAVFNILPIAPLDGSKILFGLLPTRFERYAIPLEKYGPLVLMGLIVAGYFTHVSILGIIIWPFVSFFSKLFTGII